MLRGMMWADNYRLFYDKERLVCMVNNTVEELCGGQAPTNVVNRGKTWDLPFKEVFDVLGCRFHRDVLDEQVDFVAGNFNGLLGDEPPMSII